MKSSHHEAFSLSSLLKPVRYYNWDNILSNRDIYFFIPYPSILITL